MRMMEEENILTEMEGTVWEAGEGAEVCPEAAGGCVQGGMG